MKLWYAVMMDRDDTDWGFGSEDREVAIKMRDDWRKDIYPEAYIAVIDEDTDVCVEELVD